ncbi:SGNH/GDSL hydrolase family protein [Crocosphaera sp. XPORK-15E]|uniref:SGNH/GDSL hydrolase family protein n=1 Tax=Crocosphaera sp. XPORK-15E TaxID=3110247 RepID=UPI002B2075B6|nr:SGNH/GDSL hydrolase family protein [Crocosphaera sp. XPORK-15E]MEA5532928.1 SGNH/GDSL hydrolase family protein [Crocosphaera sp. XPORK-15E]
MLKFYSSICLTSSLSLAIASLFPNPALASAFSRIYGFGDSLSDTGNTLLITTAANESNSLIPIVPPGSFGYVNGRFSNGDIWLDRLTNRLGIPLPPVSIFAGGANENGVNFSTNSATTGEANTFPIPLPGLVGLEQQITQFQTANNTADPNALYIIWAGANDYLGGGITDPSEPVANLSSAVETLYNLGSRHFLVGNLPALGQTPLALSQGTEVINSLNQVTAGHNFLLSQSLDNLRLLSGIDLKLLDIASLFENIITLPADFGFNVVDAPCLVNSPLFTPPPAVPSQCENPDQYLFWDDLHPSAATHQFIGDLAFQTLSIPESSPVVGILAFGSAIAALSLITKQ